MMPYDEPSLAHIDQRRMQRPRRVRDFRRQLPGQRMHDPARMRERINTMKMWKLTEYLDLSEGQSEKVFPRTREHEKEVDEFMKKRRELYEGFQKKVDAGKVQARDIDRYLDDVAQLEKTLIDLRTRHVKSLKDVLTDEQLAKFAIFDERFRQRLRNQLELELGPATAPAPEEGEE